MLPRVAYYRPSGQIGRRGKWEEEQDKKKMRGKFREREQEGKRYKDILYIKIYENI